MGFSRVAPLCSLSNIATMAAPFQADFELMTIPTVPMIAISFVSFLDNFCYSLVNPIIPYMCKVYFPHVS